MITATIKMFSIIIKMITTDRDPNNLKKKHQVLSRACFLLHCAHTVHECNKGNWPAWLKAQV